MYHAKSFKNDSLLKRVAPLGCYPEQPLGVKCLVKSVSPVCNYQARLSVCIRAFWLLVGLALRAPSQVAVDSWAADNGLPQNIVSAICQTPDGYIWLATFDGMVRFDGVRFTVFNRSNTPGIYGNRFAAMLCTNEGELWLGTDGSGVTRYRGGRFITYTIRDGLLSDNVEGLSGDDKGNVWALSGGYLNHWLPAEQRFAPMAGEEHRYSGSLSPDGHLGFFKITGGMLHLFIRGRRSQYPLPVDWPPDPTSTARAFSNQILVTTSTGTTVQLVDGRWSNVLHRRTKPFASGEEIGFFSLYRDSNAGTWVSAAIWDGSPIAHYLKLPPSSQPSGIAYKSLFEDREGNIWLTTDGQGLFRVRRQNIGVYSKEQGLPDRNVYPIYQTKDGAIWIGTWSGGLSRLQDGKVRTYSTQNGLASNRVYALFEDSDRSFWVSVEHGLYKMRGDTFEPVADHGINSNNLFIRAIQQDRQGTMWFGTSGGLMSLEKGRWKLLSRRDGLATDDARIIINGQAGNLWVGGYGGLSSIQEGRIHAWTEKDGLASNMIRSLYEDEAGVLWIGTYDGGLGRFENGRFTKIL